MKEKTYTNAVNSMIEALTSRAEKAESQLRNANGL